MIYVADKFDRPVPYPLRKADRSGRFIFAQFEGISDIDAAQKLVGRKVFLPRDLLEALPDGEYYWQDLIGLWVTDEAGKALGRIESIFPTGSNDVFVCRNENDEVLIPAIDGVVLHVDLNEGTMTVKMPEGL